jgi:hypothetical protein
MSRTTQFCTTLEFDYNSENADVQDSKETGRQLRMQQIKICQTIEADKKFGKYEIVHPDSP